MSNNIKIENNTTWDTQELKKLFNLISKHEGYYPRKVIVVYSRKHGMVTGRGTVGPGWVRMGFPNKTYMSGCLCTLGKLSESMLKRIAQVYIHELDHNRRLRHKEMAPSHSINVDYVQGIEIHRMKVQKKSTRTALKPFLYKGFKIKIYKYPHRIKHISYKTKAIQKTKTLTEIITLYDTKKITYGYRYSFIIYKNNKRIYSSNKIFKENKLEIKIYIKKRIDNYFYKKYT